MIERIAQPYEEAEIIKSDRNEIKIRLPWLEIDLELTEQLSMENILENLSIYPIAHLVPKNKSGLNVHHESEYFITPLSFLRYVLLVDLSDDLAEYFSEKQWTYPESILEKALIEEGVFDPISIFTSIRREHYRHLITQTDVQIIQMLEKHRDNETLFFDIVLKLIANNYYVTKRAQECIENAKSIENAPTDQIVAFTNEENGHDRILRIGIESLNVNPENLSFFEESILMMNILKSSSSRSDFFTGFCCLLTFFEGASYEEIDSRADYLSKFPKYKIVADCLQKHRKINLIGNHFSKGLEFLKEYKPINYRQAVYAMRIFELIKMVNSKLLQKIAYED